MRKTVCRTVEFEPRYFKNEDEWIYFMSQLGYTADEAREVEFITVEADVSLIEKYEEE